MCAKLGVFLSALLLCMPAPAFAEAGEFTPTIHSYGGNFVLNMLHQKDQNTTMGSREKSSDLFASEQLQLYVNGFIYHPRFIQFLVKGSGDLSQERYRTTVGSSFSETELGNEYSLRTRILPEHPYSLELYTLRSNPLLSGNSIAGRPTRTEKGALFQYVMRPVFFHMSYIAGTDKTRTSSSQFRSTSADGSYNAGPTNNTASYSLTDSWTSSGMHVSRDSSSFQNRIRVRDASLQSIVSRQRAHQTSLFSPELETDTLSWVEQFNAQLPWNFSTAVDFRFQKFDKTTGKTATEQQRDDYTESKSTSFLLEHKLYESVRTACTAARSRTETNRGDTETNTQSLSSAYTKKIPRGRLNINVSASRSLSDQQNAPLILGESYQTALFGSFTLLRESIDPATISVQAMTDAGELRDLVINMHYLVEPGIDHIAIRILSLPAEIAFGHDFSHIYTFHVSYMLSAGSVSLETTATGYGMNFSLFDNLLSPYHDHRRTWQDVLAGHVPGGAQETETNIWGVRIRLPPYTFMTEYMSADNPTRPARSMRYSAEYTDKLNDTVNFAGKLRHSNTRYGDGIQQSSGGYREKESTINGRISKNILYRNFSASIGTAYTQRKSRTDTDLFVLAGNLSWRFQAMTLNVNASLNRMESVGIFGKQTTLSEYYFLTLSRKLF